MNSFRTKAVIIAGALALAASAASAPIVMAAMPMQGAMGTKMVGGAAMYPTKTIVENAINSKDHTTLVAAVKEAGLVDTLNSAGPFTVFAPTNAAFDKLPKAAVASLMQPENKAALAKVLTFHVVAGRHSAAELMDMVKSGGGKTMLTTVEGEKLTVTQSGSGLWVADAKGDKAMVTIGDVNQSNGVIHVVDTVLMPS
ncbi:MAG: fasciclin domain-containing protein [Caulobacteraceae bacterium]